ncbi:uncharacterized protein SETTUDRAFT_36070 [Exserohilum turcica Et28A]|uniref:Uncharacterized protein n=1 Tax=Exserohilum turcicum (strain 28A) TaxID=671987 RepID=R0JY95_EXST2|nr:uncharacterized protein SETTUDRAFT_36070 [Exserohilum turcica Et28A]EOA81197.1 hypothetical protein SETTUDRAFT_36070 [Exserohilum turcica Et28A]
MAHAPHTRPRQLYPILSAAGAAAARADWAGRRIPARASPPSEARGPSRALWHAARHGRLPTTALGQHGQKSSPSAPHGKMPERAQAITVTVAAAAAGPPPARLLPGADPIMLLLAPPPRRNAHKPYFQPALTGVQTAPVHT